MQGAVGNIADSTARVYEKLGSGRRFRGRTVLACLEAEVSANGERKEGKKQFSDVRRHISVKY